MKKPKLSAKALAKHEVSVKSKLPWAYKMRKKQKERIYRVLELSIEGIQSLSLSLWETLIL